MPEVPDNPDRPCTECGERSWVRYAKRKPEHYPDSSDVIKHFFACENCTADGFAYHENGHIQYSAALRHATKK